MLRSMYSGVSGMKNFQTKLDVIGNNISNVNTIGYKKSTINFQDLLSQNLSSSGANPMQVGLGSASASISVNHNAGSAMTTGVGTDLAIMGDGFFVVKETAPSTKQYLTRSGNFTVAEDGKLITAQGHEVQGIPNAGGAATSITIPQGTDSFYINGLGEVITKNAAGVESRLSSVAISAPENPSGLSKVGGSLYEMTTIASANGIDPGTATAKKTEIGSGMLEMSNVDLTEEFTEMIIAQRGFQANSRTITTSDEVLQEVINLKR